MWAAGNRTRSRLIGERILLDCRWLGIGGTGRVTESLLQELASLDLSGQWILWGRRELLASRTFPGAQIKHVGSDPRSLLGQRDLGRIPSHDVAVFMNQIRPLRPGRSVTMIHDTIPFRYGGVAPIRFAKRQYFRLTVRLSTHLVTQSEHSLASIERDLGIPRDRMYVAHLNVEADRAAKIRELRDRLPRLERLLYVGQFRRHKNLMRLCLAFVKTEFALRGGTLLLVGGDPPDVASLERWLGRCRLHGISVLPVWPEEDLLVITAQSKALIAPALEEGFGLPAFEAAAAGMPVAASRTGAMSELPAESAVFFDPYRVEDIRRAIDDVVARRDPQPFRRPSRALAPVFLTAIEATLRDGDPSG